MFLNQEMHLQMMDKATQLFFILLYNKRKLTKPAN
jgi:hypothetical protein